MCSEECDYYEPVNRITNKLCKHFTGNEKKQREIDRCRYHCTIIDCQSAMCERSYKRHKGALKQC